MHQSITLAPETVDLLIRSTLQLAAADGAGALSSRAIGEHAGISPSAVNYRFGSLAGLIAAANTHVDHSRALAWQESCRKLEGLSLCPEDFGPAAFSALRDRIARLRGEESLFWHEAVGCCRKDGVPANTSGFAAEALFWETLLERCGMARVPPGVIQCFALAVRFAWMAFETPEEFDPWALALVMRFAERARGDAPKSDADCAWRQHAQAGAEFGQAALVPDHDTARRVVAAAIELIMSEGAPAVTHRSTAAKAGLSVSSVQHFFGSRQALLLAAYRSIYDTARHRALRSDMPVGTLKPDALFKTLTAGRSNDPKQQKADFAAMHGLILSASETCGMRQIAKGLLARTGDTSMDILRALKDPRGKISRLDGQILSMTLSQTTILELFPKTGASAHEKHLSMADYGNRLIEALFF